MYEFFVYLCINMSQQTEENSSEKPVKKSRISVWADKALGAWQYINYGVWNDTRRTWRVDVLKTVSLSIRSFTNASLQTQACAMTYRTLLAIVPALAMVFAIGRGFGFQDTIIQQLYKIFPAQHQLIDQCVGFVDKYLNTATEGMFVGVGLVVLLWTLISLISNVEDTFNTIWGIKQGRSIWRKITDYTAMLLILPVLMICAGGLQMMLTTTLQTIFHFDFLTPFVTFTVEAASVIFVWLFFSALYLLIPNVKVKLMNALLAGVLAGTGFLILQWGFVNGQSYVARYNAVYGSFSFLPLFLLWAQLAWVVTLSGAVLCYSSQSIFQFSFDDDIANISPDYRSQITLAIATVIVQSYVKQVGAPRVIDIVKRYDIPVRLVSEVTDKLVEAGVVVRVLLDKDGEEIGFQPALEPSEITLNSVRKAINHLGKSDFIPDFSTHFAGVENIINRLNEAILANNTFDVRLADIELQLIPVTESQPDTLK